MSKVQSLMYVESFLEVEQGGNLSSIERFEDLDVWKKARELTKAIYERTRNAEFARDYCLKDQIRRAAISIISNISEGFERQSDKEFQYFLSVAKGSSGEVRAPLYVALDAHLINEDQFNELFLLTEEVSRMIYGLMTYLRKTRLKV